jgi:adenylyltransferase/sulfurtransferase
MIPLIPDSRATEHPLSEAERSRYARHLTLPEVGPEGQRRLKASRVLCLGAGGLGSPVTMYLAAAGIGEIGLVDDDRVDFSNLQRQILHGTSDVGRLKIESARDRLAEINPEVRVTIFGTRFTAENAAAIAEPYDLIIDGTDNFPTRYLSNDLAVLTKKPNVYGSIYRFEGQVSVFAPHLGGPCYRCLFPEPPAPGLVPSCAEGGVLGILPGIVGAMQANEAVKLLLGLGDPLIGRLVHFDALAFRFREIKLRRDPDCAICGDSPTLTKLQDLEFTCDMNPPSLPEIDVHQLKDRLDQGTPFVLLDVREPAEIEVACLPGSVKIPLGELPTRISELDPSAETIIHCKAGGRSAKALQLLLDSGFTKACHVQGGINAWSKEIDPSVPLY